MYLNATCIVRTTARLTSTQQTTENRQFSTAINLIISNRIYFFDSDATITNNLLLL